LRVLSDGTRRKRRDRQRLTGNLEAREHPSTLQVASKFSFEKGIEQYHGEDKWTARIADANRRSNDRDVSRLSDAGRDSSRQVRQSVGFGEGDGIRQELAPGPAL